MILRQKVDAATFIDSVRVWVIPSSLRNRNNPGGDTRGDQCGNSHASTIIEDVNQIAIFDTTHLRIRGIDPRLLWVGFLVSRKIGVGRMCASLVMMSHELEWVFGSLGARGIPILVGQDLLGEGRKTIKLIVKLPHLVHVIEFLREDFELA